MTGKLRHSESAVMMSSVMPSAKYSCSGSPLILSKGRTAMAGLLGNVRLCDRVRFTGLVAQADAIDPDRLGNVLHRVFACVLESRLDLAHDLVVNKLTQSRCRPVRPSLEPRRHIDAVAVDVPFVNDDVTRIDADTELQTALRRHSRSDASANRWHTPPHRRHSETPPRAVAHEFDDAAPMCADQRLDDVLAKHLECGNRARLVLAHEAAVADDVGSKYGSEAALHAVSPYVGRLSKHLDKIHAAH